MRLISYFLINWLHFIEIYINDYLWPVLAIWVRILTYKGKKKCQADFEVFTKMSSLSPLLAIPMLQIVIKHLKWSLFVRFLSTFSLLASGRLLLLITCCRSIVASSSIPALWIFISSPNQWNMIFGSKMLMLMKTIRSRWPGADWDKISGREI